MVKQGKKNSNTNTAITKSVKNTDFNKFIEKKLQQVIDIVRRSRFMFYRARRWNSFFACLNRKLRFSNMTTMYTKIYQ